MASKAVKVYGWNISPYSQKCIAYLRYKSIPHKIVDPTMWQMFRTLPKHTGTVCDGSRVWMVFCVVLSNAYNLDAMCSIFATHISCLLLSCSRAKFFFSETGVRVIPVMQTHDNVWIQDSRAIIDYLEPRHPEKPVFPDLHQRPVHRFVSSLIECWSDEVWPPIAMHTRWSFHDYNYKFFQKEIGQLLLPHFPAFMKNYCVNVIATNLRKIMIAVGVRPNQFDQINAWTEDCFDKLELHFKSHKYLLGVYFTGTAYSHR
jgi:glutathione S-transferase